ncbi:MAG: repeat protein, partial [Flavipsychrobacter sp.]|nr:repeat protein [Flavipsychrobacter sp.]
RNKPTGTWQEFYSNGKPKTIANYTIVLTEKGTTSFCLTGTWEEFYSNGKLKVSGHYSAAETKVKDTLTVEDPITEQKVLKVSTRTQYGSVKSGVWEYYSENGELEKKEEL